MYDTYVCSYIANILFPFPLDLLNLEIFCNLDNFLQLGQYHIEPFNGTIFIVTPYHLTNLQAITVVEYMICLTKGFI